MSEPEPATGGSLWRRLATRVLVISGIAYAASFLMPSLPREQILVFRVGAEAPLKHLSASYTLEGEREPRSGVKLSYDGAAPKRVQHVVSLPNGRYVMAVAVERALPDGGTKETSYLRRVNLEGGETILPVEDP
ncbi:MAG: hypothetical protein IPI67_18850 [Myxococcales bacterium]|nr:hypothetical protein [Myxococcales bacterium]